KNEPQFEVFDLSHNELSYVPHRACLTWPHLNGLTCTEDWSDLKETLSTLLLGANDMDGIPREVFRDFRRLLWLSLENNNILRVNRGAFPENIQTLNLDHNLLSGFPIEAIDSIKTLSWFMMRGNLLDRLPTTGFKVPKILDKLDLGENFIRFIPDNLFNRTLSVRDLYLDFNSLSEIQDEAFKGLNPGRLYLSSNSICNITDKAFHGGPDNSIVMLDLDKNALTFVPKALAALKGLKYLYMPNNKIKSIPSDAFRSFCEHLEALSLSGNDLSEVPRDGLENCSMINHLNLGHNHISEIKSSDFETWGDNLATLILRNNRLYNIPAHAFKFTPKLNELSLSFNRILDVNENSFIDVINTLEILEISFGFYRDDFPEEVLKPLTSLKWIALDNNNFRTITETALYSFGKLAYFNMDSNRLTHIPKNLFHQNVHKKLADIRLAYNFISTASTHTFHNLEGLRTLVLNGNKIETIEFEAFKNLPNLVTILLSDNQISSIHDKAFSDLPNLMELDLQKNNLRKFSLTAFANSTSSLVPLSLNLSSNDISQLDPFVGGNVYLKSADLSDNQFKEVPLNFLKSFGQSMQRFDLGYNKISSLDNRAFGDLDNLQMLSLEHNTIQQVRQGAFNGIPSVQLMDLSHNHLESLPYGCFADIRALRSLDLSYNHLRSLPKSVFVGTVLETLKLSHNEFVSMPATGLASVAKSLHYLDISNNHIEHLDSTMFYSFSSLVELNLANNKLTILPDNVFVSLTSLLTLDLSANPVRANFKELFHYTQKIQKLNLAKIGFTSFPIIPLPNLISLNLSSNSISDVEIPSIVTLTQLRELDLSRNKISHVHSRIWGFMPYLKILDLSFNPIKSLTKDSFMGASRIETLVIRGLDEISRFDYDTLSHMSFLRELFMNTFPNIEKYRFRVGHLLATVHTFAKTTFRNKGKCPNRSVIRSIWT
ncbi:Chaoptin, partial [Armadillidium vulgare]